MDTKIDGSDFSFESVIGLMLSLHSPGLHEYANGDHESRGMGSENAPMSGQTARKR